MTVDVDPLEDAPPRRRWRMRVSLVMGGVALIAMAGLWTQRRPIAEGFVDRELAARGVTASYRIDRLGIGRQRLVDVVIGDPRDPDLVAEQVDIELDVGLSGASLHGIAARGVRVRGRIVDGRVSLGAIDRLLPPPSGEPFALPRIWARLEDARLRLETPAGTIGLRIDGRGGLHNGFAGRVAAVAGRLAAGGCTLAAPRAMLAVHIDQGRPAVRGPVRSQGLACTGAGSGPLVATVDATLAEALDRWSGRVRLDAARVAGAGVAADRVAGNLAGRGDWRQATGRLALAVGGLAAPQGRVARADITGDARIGGGAPAFAGRVDWREAQVAPALLAPLIGAVRSVRGTPVAPILGGIAEAASRAGRSLSGRAELALADGALRIASAQMRSASGAEASLGNGRGLVLDGEPRIDGDLRIAGGGLPELALTLRQSEAGAPVGGTGTMQPYRVGDAGLALSRIEATATPGGNRRLRALATLTGPVANGRVEDMVIPLDVLIGRGGRIVANADCTPLAFRRFTLSGLTLDPGRLRLCPRAEGLLTLGPGGVRGGARIVAPRLTGRIGSTPVTLAADAGEVAVETTGFVLTGLASRIGRPDAVTRLDFARVEGAGTATGLAGIFSGASGQIANVPLLHSDGAGQWRLAGGVLTLDGAVMVADAATDPRFRPVRVPDMRVTVAGNDIAAGGTLIEPVSGTRIADAAIVHDLGAGAGNARLNVPGIAFGPRLQPEALTRLTLGVVANVRGTVTGEGRIAWDDAGVRSTGVFRATAMNLAAAFGPVTGLSTEVRFSDLLGLVSEPGQVATVAEINPGVAVRDGTVRYRLLPEQRVGVEGGRWPFAGGELTLAPTVLDFAEDRERRLTFTVTGLDAGRFVQLMEFENIAATGVFDGSLPMVFDAGGGRIVGGSLVVRPGGGTLSYVGEVSNAALGPYAKLAFDALKSVRYDRLTIGLDGAIDGEIVSRIRFDGVNQGPLAVRTGIVASTISRLPFRFNITIRAPFRGLLSTARSFTDPSEIIRSQIPAAQPLGSSTELNVQPQDSRNRP